jgi:hypothetical protein
LIFSKKILAILTLKPEAQNMAQKNKNKKCSILQPSNGPGSSSSKKITVVP